MYNKLTMFYSFVFLVDISTCVNINVWKKLGFSLMSWWETRVDRMSTSLAIKFKEQLHNKIPENFQILISIK